MDCSTPGLPSITNSWSLLKLRYIESVMPSNHLILFCPLLFSPSIFPSIRVFPNESALRIRWSKYWNFSFNISPSNEHSGLISFRMDWMDLLAVQGTLKSLLQHHSSKASILQWGASKCKLLTNLWACTWDTLLFRVSLPPMSIRQVSDPDTFFFSFTFFCSWTDFLTDIPWIQLHTATIQTK